MRLRLLVDSGEFWESLRSDLLHARHEAFVQAMTLEGDSVGLALAAALGACTASDRRVVLDSFTLERVSDRWVLTPAFLFSRALRDELSATRRMLAELPRAGVRVHVVNPFGWFYRNAPARNHKKLAVIDGRVAYLGGINFSEHNFAWRDLMLRIEDPSIAATLRADFLATDAGERRAMSHAFPGLTLLGFDGLSNSRQFAAVLGLIEEARESVVVQCPYITPPFTQAFANAAARGVRVQVLMPEANNWRLSREHVMDAAAAGGFELLLYPERMSHLKALLVDERTLVVGSANFDFLSHDFQQELAAVVTDPAVVDDYRRRVLWPDLRASRPCRPRSARFKGRLATFQLQALRRFLRSVVPGAEAGLPAPADVVPVPLAPGPE